MKQLAIVISVVLLSACAPWRTCKEGPLACVAVAAIGIAAMSYVDHNRGCRKDYQPVHCDGGACR